MLFPTTVVGSLPRPEYVKDLQNLKPINDFEYITWQSQMNNAVEFVISMMNNTGIDIITDGEWRRKSYTDVFAQMASGFIEGEKIGKEFSVVGNKKVFGYVVIDKIKHIENFIAKEAGFAKSHTKQKLKICIPSPFILGQRMWHDGVSNNAYLNQRDFVLDTIEVLRNEIKEIHKIGVETIQIDEPTLSAFIDPIARKKFSNPEKDLDFLVECINQVTYGFDDINFALHICRFNRGRLGWRNEGGYEPIIPALKKINVQEYTLEFSIPVAGDYEILKKLPEDKKIALGCVDCRQSTIESPETIANRVEIALKFIDKERILLSPDCGFAPAISSDIPLDEAYQKLQNEAKAATLLRDKYS